MSERRVVIVGAGFAGLNAARGLANVAGIQVTVIDRRNHHLFQPLLYQVATAALSPADIAAPVRSVLRRARNTEVLLGEVAGVDLAARTVTGSFGVRTFDWLVLACGTRNSWFGRDDWAPLAPGLKSLEDALEIRRRLLLAFERAEQSGDPAGRDALLTFVVVGGGPTGVELAGALAEISRFTLARDFRRIDPRRARVVLVEGGPRLLAAFAPRLSERARQDLEKLGVAVRVGAKVSRVGADGVDLDGAETIAARTVLWAAGVAPSELNAGLGVPLARGGRVPVGSDLALPGRPEVFVLGDQGECVQGGAPLPALAPVAIQQGRHAAAQIRADLAGRPRRPFRYRDKGSMATIGRKRAVAELGRLRLAGFPAWLLWMLVHILYLITFRARLLVMINWAWSFVTLGRGARLITGAPPDVQRAPDGGR